MKNIVKKDQKEVKDWMEACQARIDEYMEKSGYAPLQAKKISIVGGRRYIKVVAKSYIMSQEGEYRENGCSVWAFIDAINGDIRKPASWKAPAKHARGNLFDESKGQSWMTAYGPQYLR